MLALVSVTTLTAFGATSALAVASAQATTVRTCQGGGAGYTVNVPQTLGNTGGDPYEQQAVDCTIGYHEKLAYPLSIIGIVLAFTAATLIVMYRKKDSLDFTGGAGFGATGGDA
jgi:hypothetical protein